LVIIVLVKYVPDMLRVRFDVDRGRVDRSSADLEINPFDLNALEAAVRIKEELGGQVFVLSMGPRRTESALKDTLARGADSAFLLEDRKFAGADTLATSYTIASAVRQLGHFDLILCGEKTVDGDTGQVGPEVAEHLDMPHIACAYELNVTRENVTATCDIGMERCTFKTSFPALITVTKDINIPRLPAFRDRARARQMAVRMMGAAALSGTADVARFGVQGSPTKVYKVIVPSDEGRRGKIFRQASDEVVDEVAERICHLVSPNDCAGDI
jgi:electron transfer flavoprotein beta subunit